MIFISLVTAWATAGLYYLGLIHSWHAIDLQKKEDLKLVHLEPEKWGVYHFFDSRCSCSHTIIQNLLDRSPLQSRHINERIFYHESLGRFYGPLKAKGYQLVKINFRESGVTGVPLLVVFDPERNISYAGGYDKKSVNSVFPPNEKKLIYDIIAGKNQKKLPVIGCSVSKKYQKILDPLGLKYANLRN